MARRSRLGGRTAATFAAVVGLGVAVSPAPVMAVSATQTLPGATLSAAIVDLDADGAREVIRLVDPEGVGFRLEAWDLNDERWSMSGATELIPRRGDGSAPTAATGDIGSLLTWQLGGSEEVLALTAVATATDDGPPWACCLEVSAVRHMPIGLELEPVAWSGGPADFVQSVDIDGDGTDELVTTHTTISAAEPNGSTHLEVHRWDGRGFGPVFEMDSDQGFGVTTGESDGVTGRDIVIGPTQTGDLQRLSWRNARVVTETGHLDLGEEFSGWMAGIADGALVLATSTGMSVARWPRDAAPSIEERLTTLTFPSSAVVGEGPDALIVTHDGFGLPSANGPGPSTMVYDIGLHLLGEVDLAPGTEAFWDLATDPSRSTTYSMQRVVVPYLGPLPNGLGGRPAYVSSGVLISPGGASGFETRPMGPLIGTQPIGVAGPRGTWAVLADGVFLPPGGTAYLHPAGQRLEGSGTLVLTPLTGLMSAADAHSFTIQFQYAVVASRETDRTKILAKPDGFTALITGPPGSVVVVGDRAMFEEHEIVDGPVAVNIAAPRGSQGEGNEDFKRWLLLISPDGRGTIEHWDGTFVRDAPQLDATAATDLLSLSAAVNGRAPGAVEVLVDGRTVNLTGSGTFSTTVEAPIWPRDVMVVARDALGTEAMARLQVVGLADYRGLPWVPIIGGLTVACGAVFFLRTPRRRTQRMPATEDGTVIDDGHLEDLELEDLEQFARGDRGSRSAPRGAGR